MNFRFLSLFLILSTTQAFADYPDGSTWKITEKKCDGSDLKILGEERIFFGNSMFAHRILFSEDIKQVCYETKAYTRIAKSFSGNELNYQETAELSPLMTRFICKDKVSGTVSRDNTNQWTDQSQVLSLELNHQQGKIELRSDKECSSGTLVLSVQFER
jgi:hypothetical protein